VELADTVRQVAISAVPILIAITFHEVAHGWVAYRLGDGTAKALGRLTINPLAHIDPFGTVLMPIMLYIFSNGQFVFGYARPVPINPYNFKNPRQGMALSAAAGPAMNLALAVVCLVLMKFAIAPLSYLLPDALVMRVLEPVRLMLYSGIIMNVVLASFNLIPVPPLDGGRILAGFLPVRQAIAFEKLERYGMIIVILLIATGAAQHIVRPLMRLFLGLLSLI
jgi:Zn-dependent protease